MKMLFLELKKEKRTGVFSVMVTVGILGAGYEFADFAVRGETFLHLSLAPMEMLLTQLYGMVMVLNLFGIVVAACLSYYVEWKENGIKKMYLLPLNLSFMYVCKFLVIMMALLGAVFLENLSLTKIGCTVFSPNTFEAGTQIRFAGYSFLTSLPVLSFMVLIASRFENIWIPLGVGVAGFLSGMALAHIKSMFFLIHPFILMLKPALAMDTRLEGEVVYAALAETFLFLLAGAWMAKHKGYE